MQGCSDKAVAEKIGKQEDQIRRARAVLLQLATEEP
jgi:hypothetical protein